MPGTSVISCALWSPLSRLHIPWKSKLITSARVKTDARDTLHLARLLAAGLIPAVWIPPQDVRELRALVAHHTRLIRQRTQAKNRLRSTLHRYNIVPPDGGLFAAAQRSWWEALALSAVEKLRIRQDLSVLASLEPLIAEVQEELTRLSGTEPWLSQVVFLLQVPGIGVINALVRLSAIGDITRFPTAKQLVGYAGLGASVHASGQTYQTGHITRQGRKEMRAALVESAWMAVEHHPYWKVQFELYSVNMLTQGGLRRAPPLLESAIRAALGAYREEESHCGDRPQTAGCRLACAFQAGG